MSLWPLEERLLSRAKGFHRAVERIWQALRTDDYATGDPRGSYLAAVRRWKEFDRARRRYGAAGGDIRTQGFVLYHLANAYSCWVKLRLPAPHAKRLEAR